MGDNSKLHEAPRCVQVGGVPAIPGHVWKTLTSLSRQRSRMRLITAGRLLTQCRFSLARELWTALRRLLLVAAVAPDNYLGRFVGVMSSAWWGENLTMT